MWLTCYGGPYAQGEKNTESQRYKAKSRPPIPIRWLELYQDPEVASSNTWMKQVVLRDLRQQEPALYEVLHEVYLSPNADYAAPARWRLNLKNTYNARRYKMYRLAMEWVVNRLGTRVLVIPNPEEAASLVEESRNRQAVCRAVYWNAYKNTGSKAKARKAACRASGYSPQHVGRIVATKHRKSA